MLKWNRAVITCKTETTAGVDAEPTAADNAILARNIVLKPIVTQRDARNVVLPHFGNMGEVVAGSFQELSYDVEMAGGGAAGTAPGWGPVIKACGFSETINSGVSVVYAPISTAESSATQYVYVDGKHFKLTYSKGNVVLMLEAGKVPLLRFRFQGLYVAPTDTALPAPTLTAFQAPLAVNKVNTTPFTLHSYAGKFRSLEIDAGNQISYRNLPNFEGIVFTGRQSRGRAVLEDELMATKDWYAIIKAGTAGALAVTHGTAAGNKVAIAAAGAQLEESDLSNESGIAMNTMPFNLRPSSAGNDEFTLTVT